MRRFNRLIGIQLLSTTILSVTVGYASAAVGDWPQWRGPNHDDSSSEGGLLREWPAGGPPLLWKATGLGAGYSGVTVVGNRVYTAGDKGDRSVVIALNAQDGKPLWSANLGKTGPGGGDGQPKFDGPRATPSVDQDLVFMVGQYGEMACYNAGTGKELWRKDWIRDLGGICPQWAFSESPLVDGDQVVMTPGGAEGAIVALNKNSGALVWRSKGFNDSPQYSTMLVEAIGGIRQYIQLTAQSVVGVAAKDGKVLWRAPRKGNVAVIPSPIYAENAVYVTSGYGSGCNLFKIACADGQFTAQQVYANKSMANHHGGVIKVGEYLYGYAEGKGWMCQDFASGEAKWQEKEKLGKGSIAFADGHFYLRQEAGRGTVALIDASPDGYKEHGRFDQPDRSNKNSWPHPVMAGGRLFLRDQDVLLCYDVRQR